MKKETLNPEDLASQHKQAARRLERITKARENIKKSGIVRRASLKVRGKTKVADLMLEGARKDYDESVDVSKETVSAIHERAMDILATRSTYVEARDKLDRELASQHKKGVGSVGVGNWPGKETPNSVYVEDFDELKLDRKVSDETMAKLLAVRDIFYTVMDNPGYPGSTYIIGEVGRYNQTSIAVSNGQRSPRLDLGSKTPEAALEAAKANGWQKVVKTSMFITYKEAEEGKERPHVVREKNVFTAVDDETAELIGLIAPTMDHTTVLSPVFGPRSGMPTGEIFNQETSVLNVADLEQLSPPQTA